MTRLVVLCLALVSLPATAAECYAVDPAAGSVSFELKQAGASFRGVFRRLGGEVCLADGRVARVAVWLDPASSDTGLPEIDAALKDKEFFAVRDHPRIAFASRSVEARGDGQRARAARSKSRASGAKWRCPFACAWATAAGRRCPDRSCSTGWTTTSAPASGRTPSGWTRR